MVKSSVNHGVKTLLLRGGQALVLLEPEGGFDLPGGRVEEGEYCLDCLRREIQEETGLEKVEITNSFASWSFLKRSGLLVEGITLLCIYTDGTVRLSQEHSGFMWVPLNQLRSMEIYWKYGLDGFRFDFIRQSSERREAYGGMDSRRNASGSGGRI
jgi:8-oxo-dGTP diphosphatase